MQQRIALKIEYNGAAFYGWQQQIGLPTIQGTLTQAISQIANHPTHCVVAGRTDRGVHATGQVVHFDTHANRSDRTWMMGINAHLPSTIRVKAVQQVSENFHARFSAVSRSYCYQLDNTEVANALYHQCLSWHPRPLDVAKMHQAAQVFVGEHDFSAVQDSQCQAKSPVRTIHVISVDRQAQRVILKVTANAFLHHMVRNLVGVLLPIGDGRKPISFAASALASCDRRCAGVTATPNGLVLTHVEYKDETLHWHDPDSSETAMLWH